MRGAIRTDYGGPDEVETRDDLPGPEPTPGRVVVEVAASSINALDAHQLTGTPYLLRTQSGLRRPKDRRLGTDLVGVVVSVGDGVDGFAIGDRVLGMARGAFAHRVSVLASSLAALPGTVDDDVAGAAPVAGLSALQALRAAGMRPGARVLVIGAGGGVGTSAVQIARAEGAANVTAQTRSEAAGIVHDLGADRVVGRDDDPLAGTEGFDVVLDVSGVLGPRRLRDLLRPGGCAVLVGLSPHAGPLLGPLPGLLGPVPRSRRERRVIPFLAHPAAADFATLAGLLADGSLRSLVAERYPLGETRAAFSRYLEGGVTGKIVIDVTS